MLGLDVATVTGMCWMDTAQPPSSWRVFALETEGECGEEKSGDLSVELYGLIQQRRPDFAAIEMPQRSVKRFGKKVQDPVTGKMVAQETINPNALQLSALAGGVVATLDICGVPWGLVAPNSWRPAYFGSHFRPRQKWDSSRKEMVDDWKGEAVDLALLQGVVLPDTQKGKADAAEAVGIAHAWARCTMIPKRHQQAFMALRTRSAVAA